MTYTGSCHCGAVKFTFEDAEPLTGVRCNCSICKRKGAVMSEHWYPATVELAQPLGVYQWQDFDVKHCFCTTCGVFVWGEIVQKPGKYRLNMGCVDGIDALALPIRLIDGASL